MSFDEDACYETSLDIPSGKYGKLIAIPAPGATGSVGPQGIPGPVGPVGPAGPEGPAGPAEGAVEYTVNKGTAGGYAPLDAGAKVEAKYLPSYVDDVLEFTTQSVFPQPGTAGVIYVDLATGNTFRWSGSTYVAVSDKVLSTGITDSTVVGRKVIVAVDEAAARTAIGAENAAQKGAPGGYTPLDSGAKVPAENLPPFVPKAAPAAGDPVADVAVLDAALAANAFVRVDDGEYVVPAAGVTVPAGKSLLVGEGATIKLADGQVGGAAGLFTAVQLGDGATFIGAVDGNRAAQDRAAYNAGPGSANRLILAAGTAAAPLRGLHIDAQVSNAVNSPLRLDYVNDSYVRIRAKDCGGAIVFEKCDNLEVDIEVDGTDNLGWKIWQHAVDFHGCTRIRGRVVVRDQSGTGRPSEGTGLSDWNSGLTMLDCSDITFDEVDVDFSTKPDQSKGLGVSLLGVRDIHVGRLRIVGASDGMLELGGVVDGTFVGLDLDGRYAKGKAGNTGSGVGVNVYNLGSPADLSGNTLQHSRNLKFLGGTIRRCLSNGINMKASKDTAWYGIEVSGCLYGLKSVAFDQSGVNGPAPTVGENVPKNHRFIGCDFVFNERDGVNIEAMVNSAFHSCRANKNSQSVGFGGTRNGLGVETGTAGFRTVTGVSKTGLVWSGDCQADDSQGVTAPGFPDPARPNVVAVDRVERFGVGQTVTLKGAGAAGADLLTRVDAVTADELTLQHPVATFPPVALTGTISTSGKTVTGANTKFLTELVGRAWVKVGSEYQRVAKVASDTSATLAAGFTTNVPAGTALVIVRVDVVTAQSQQYGYVFSADTVEPVLGSTRVPTGNVVAQMNDLSSGGYRTLFAPVVANNMVVRGVGTLPPEIRAAGPNANTSMVVKSQGLGSVWIRDGNENNIAMFQPVAGQSNYLQFTNQGSISVQSTVNANANVSILPKGSGYLNFYVSTGQTPRIQGAGADPAHNLNLNAKGTGVVQLATDANTVIGQVETKGHKHVAADITGVSAVGHTHTVAEVTGARSWVAVPASATAAGTAGQEAYDANFHYVCVTTGAAGAAAWKRTPLTTW